MIKKLPIYFSLQNNTPPNGGVDISPRTWSHETDRPPSPRYTPGDVTDQKKPPKFNHSMGMYERVEKKTDQDCHYSQRSFQADNLDSNHECSLDHQRDTGEDGVQDRYFIQPFQSKDKSQLSQRLALTPRNDSLGLASLYEDPANFPSFVDQVVPLRNLKSIYLLLQKFFRGKRITIDNLSCLSGTELDILNMIIRRKYEELLFRSSDEKKDLDSILDILQKCQHMLPAKRAEESFKFIFTRTLKRLKRLFTNKLDSQKNGSDEITAFCKQYFAGTPQSLPFITERIGKYKNPNYPRLRYSNLNLTHFRSLLSNPLFMADMNKYLEDELHEDHQIEVDRKILQLLNKWDSKLHLLREKDNENDFKRVRNEIDRYFLHNKRCKLPWTIAEVKNAIQRIQMMGEKMTSLEYPEDTA